MLLEEGLVHAGAATSAGDPSPEAWSALASLQAAAGRNEDEMRALREVVRITPNRAVGHLELGQAFQRQRRFEEAEAAFERAINLRPSWWLGYHRLALLYIEKGEFDAAANRFRRITEVVPENASGANNLGTLYYLLDRHADAEEMFQRSIRIAPNGDAFSNLGTLAFEDARFGDASGYFEKAVELQGDEYGLWGNLASAYFWGGDRERAESAFRRALELGEALREAQPIEAELSANLAGYYGVLGEHKRGLELIQEAIDLDPENEELMATIGESFEDLGDRDQALEWIGRALASGLNPTWIDRRPGLRDLTSDPRYQQLLDDAFANEGTVDP